MEMEHITNVWLEAQVDADGIGLSLLAEGRETGAVVQDVEHFTFEELESMEGDLFKMNLGDSTLEALNDMGQDAAIGRIFKAGRDMEARAEALPDNPDSEELLAYMGLLGGEATDGQQSDQSQVSNLPEVGDVLTDQNAPSWSESDWVEVVEVLPDVRSDEYVIQGRHEGEVVSPEEQDWSDETVRQANPSYAADEPVVLAQYEGSGDWYAFPASRLA